MAEHAKNKYTFLLLEELGAHRYVTAKAKEKAIEDKMYSIGPLGLELALLLNIPAIGIGAPEGLAFGLPRPCRIVIPGKRDTAIWQDFTDTPSEPQQSSLDALPPGPAEATPQVSIAEGIARLARARAGTPQPRPAPIYLRPADAAPARDRGPVILP